MTKKKKQPTRKPISPSKKKKEFDRFFEKYGEYVLLCAILVLAFIIFKDFILGEKIYLFKDIGSDSITARYPLHYHISQYIRETGFPGWSFNLGMGQNIYPQSLGNPFQVFLYISTPEKLAFSIVFAEILKIILSGFFIFLFFKELNFNSFSAITGGILYAFSGYIILGGQWDLFSTEAFHLAFILFSFERLMQKKQLIWFPLAIFLIASFQPFNLATFSIFTSIYFIYRAFTKKDYTIKKAIRFGLTLLSLSIIGVLISCVFSLPTVWLMLQSPRGGEASYVEKLSSTGLFSLEEKNHYLALILRLFSNDLAGTGSKYSLWYNYLEAPMIYIGILCLVLFPHSFIAGSKKDKIIHGTVFLLVILPAVFPYFRYAFWFFTGDYYRFYSIVISVFLLIYAISALNRFCEGDKPKWITIVITAIILFLVLLIPHDISSNGPINEKIKGHAIWFLIAYFGMVILFRFEKLRNLAKFSLFFVVLVEIGIFSSVTVNKRPVVKEREWKQKKGFNDNTLDALAYLNKKDSSFYRIHKDYFSTYVLEHVGLNDAMTQGFYGSEMYHSFSQKHYIRFLSTMNLVDNTNEYQTRWSPGVKNNEFIQTLVGYKYKFLSQEPSQFVKFFYDSIGHYQQFALYQNRIPLPISFSNNQFISIKDFNQFTDTYKKTKIALNAFVVENNDINKLQKLIPYQPDTLNSITAQNYLQAVESLQRNVLEDIQFNQNNISGNINIENDELLFFSIPYDKGWRAKINNKEVDILILYGGLIGLYVPKGEHSISLSYQPPYLKAGSWLSLIGVVLLTSIIILKTPSLKKIKM